MTAIDPRPTTRVGAAAPATLTADERSQSTGLAAVLPGITLAALRIISALVLLEHASQRAMGFPANPARPFNGAPDLFTRPWFATVLEVVGGILLILGLFTRPVAFVLSGLMAFAYFLVHAPRGFFPVVNGGEPAVLLCFILLYISTVGAGPFSLDALLRRRA
jgi:putative oxidoreductase